MQLLETDRLLLRPFTLDDAEGLYAYASHPEVGPPAGWRPHRSVEESRQVIENIFIPSDALAVLRKSDGRLIGSAGFVDRHRAELGTPSEEIGYSLARDCWGQGLIPEAVKEIGAVVEGYYAAATAKTLADKTGVEMPITEAAYQVLYHGKDPRAVITELMTRAKKHEIEESWV